MTDYDFSTSRWLAARRERVWTLLDDPAGWPAWWPGLRRVAPCPSDMRACWRFTWRGALPYTLQADVTISERDAPHTLAGTIDGVLTGEGRWLLEDDPARGTWLTFRLQVDGPAGLRRRIAPYLSGLFRRNFNGLMRAGFDGMQQALDAAPARKRQP